MTAIELKEKFGLPGILDFEERGDLPFGQVKLPSCQATVYLQGAQVTHWQPAGEQPVLFVSERSAYANSKAIRGGIPICFPWFGARSDGGPGPSHGFARVQEWELAFTALIPGSDGNDRLQMTFILAPSDQSRMLAYADFRVAYEVTLGSTLHLRLTVANFGEGRLRFEEALHSYFLVGDVRQAAIHGLENAAYLDKRDENRQIKAPNGPLKLNGFTDRVFFANPAPLTIDDTLNRRLIHIQKQDSGTTVIWNPWIEGSAPLPDLGSDEWPKFLCVEAANTATDAITLEPGQTHTMSMSVSVQPAAS